MTRQPTTTERFIAALELADTLPNPTDIYRAILAGSQEVDDGLRAANYDGERGGATTATHPERVLAQRHPDQFPNDDHPDGWETVKGKWGGRTDRAADDLLALRRATDRVLDAISSLNAECCDAGTADDWDEALQHAHLLANAGYVTAALDVGRHIDHWLLRFAYAIDTVRAIRDSWMPHAPQENLGLIQREGWCRSHQRIDVQRPRVSRLLCQQCWRDIQDLEQLGAPVDLQTDPAKWPSEAMLRAREEGRRVLFDRERQAWLRSHGVSVQQVQQRRRERRAS